MRQLVALVVALQLGACLLGPCGGSCFFDGYDLSPLAGQTVELTTTQYAFEMTLCGDFAANRTSCQSGADQSVCACQTWSVGARSLGAWPPVAVASGPGVLNLTLGGGQAPSHCASLQTIIALSCDSAMGASGLALTAYAYSPCLFVLKASAGALCPAPPPPAPPPPASVQPPVSPACPPSSFVRLTRTGFELGAASLAAAVLLAYALGLLTGWYCGRWSAAKSTQSSSYFTINSHDEASATYGSLESSRLPRANAAVRDTA